jgi:hypothetical protein
MMKAITGRTRPWARALAVVAILIVAGLSSPSHAHQIDMIEHILGATNIEAITGSGGMTIGVSRDGDLTVLTWPSPSYTDHLHYITSNDEDAREQPRFGAAEGMGAFAALVYSIDGGATLEVSWLRDDPWVRSVCYLDSWVSTWSRPIWSTKTTTSGSVASR